MRSQLHILKKPEILIIGFSSIVSGLGNWITMMAILSLIIFKGDGGVLESSGIFMAGLLPVMVFSPLAGKLADRYNRKHLMMISELGAGLTIAMIIFTDNLWLIYLSMALQAVFIALMTPARQSALPQLVDDPAELERVNAFFQQLNSILKIVAPMFAGFLLTIMNAHQAIIVDMVSFLISVVILSRLPALMPLDLARGKPVEVGAGIRAEVRAGVNPARTESAHTEPAHTEPARMGPDPTNDRAGLRPAPTEPDPTNDRAGVPLDTSTTSFDYAQRELGASSTRGKNPALTNDGGVKNEALAFLWRSVPLRLLFLSSFFTILIIVSFDILGSVYIRDVLHGDESFMGLIIGLLGVGSFLVSLLIVFRKAKGQNWPDLARGNFLLATLPLCMALGYFIEDPKWVRALIIAAGFLGGLGNGFLIIQISTILQISSPSQILGRLSGYLEFTLIGGQLFSVILLPILIPGVIEPYLFFGAAAIALWILGFTIQVQSKRIPAMIGQAALESTISREDE